MFHVLWTFMLEMDATPGLVVATIIPVRGLAYNETSIQGLGSNISTMTGLASNATVIAGRGNV